MVIVADRKKVQDLSDNLASMDDVKGRSLWSDARRRFLKNKAATTGLEQSSIWVHSSGNDGRAGVASNSRISAPAQNIRPDAIKTAALMSGLASIRLNTCHRPARKGADKAFTGGASSVTTAIPSRTRNRTNRAMATLLVTLQTSDLQVLVNSMAASAKKGKPSVANSPKWCPH